MFVKNTGNGELILLGERVKLLEKRIRCERWLMLLGLAAIVCIGATTSNIISPDLKAVQTNKLHQNMAGLASQTKCNTL